MTSMEAAISTTSRSRPAHGVKRADSTHGVKRAKATVTLIVAIVAGALMMYAAYLSQSGLRSTAWEKEQTSSLSSPPAQTSEATVPAQPSAEIAPVTPY